MFLFLRRQVLLLGPPPRQKRIEGVIFRVLVYASKPSAIFWFGQLFPIRFFCSKRHSGSKRFEKLFEAAREGHTQPPVDLRYLKKPVQTIRDHDVRSDVFSFLHNLWTSCAETLPDVRDDPLSPSEEVSLCLAGQEIDIDPYAKSIQDVMSGSKDVLPRKEKRKQTHKKGVEVNPLRADMEKRYLPPGNMKDHWEQYRIVSPLERPASFPTFWRVPH